MGDSVGIGAPVAGVSMEFAEVDYFVEASACIKHVQELVNGASGHQVQLHHFQCQYLSSKVSETGSFLTAKAVSLRAIPGSNDIRRKALRQLHFTAKRAENLVRSCCCEFEPTWLETAVTLPQIKEDIVDVLLDLRWWKSMVDIAIASVTWVTDAKIELELLECAEAEFQSLLCGAWNDLDDAVVADNEQLLADVRKVLRSYAGASKPRDHEYLLATHLRTRLENSDLTQSTANVELNAYHTVEYIGHGSFGAVMKVTWLGRSCALKLLNYKCMKEATSLSAFQHPHIVQFFRYWEASTKQSATPRGSSAATNPIQSTSDETTASSTESSLLAKSHILMELLPMDLAQHIQSLASKTRVGSKRTLGATGSMSEVQAPMSQDVAIDVMLQVVKAMWHLNSKDVAHRDLKPNNVLVRSVSGDDAPELAARGYVRAKLGDFGMVRTKAMSYLSKDASKMVGSKVYGAPEVFNQGESIFPKELRFPRKADVWSFGIMLNELLSGKPPFRHALNEPGGMAELHSRIRKGHRPELPKTCPDYLKFCITHCWQRRPQDRPSFTDLWKLVRFAQVRSLGLIRNDHNLFTFTTYDGVVRRLHKASAPDKDPSQSSSFWLLFWRITLLFARRRDPSNQGLQSLNRQPSRAGWSSKNLSVQSKTVARPDDQPLGYLVNPVGTQPDAASDTKLDVIFFEGNVGQRKYLSCKDTWVQRGKPDVWWPRDWLPKDFKGDIRILLLEYSISEVGVQGVVDELQRLLVFSDRWNRKHKWDRPIVLVGHSLGCVVIEQLVVALDDRRNSMGSLKDEFEDNRAKTAEAFLTNLAGCFFYAPPYTGLVPSEDLLKHVFGGLTYSRALFADLCLDSSKLKDLSAHFMQARSERVKLMALIEGFHTRGRTVVPPASMHAFKESGGIVKELEDSSHSDTCKPTNKEHPSYKHLFDFIDEILKESSLNERTVIQDTSGDKPRVEPVEVT